MYKFVCDLKMLLSLYSYFVLFLGTGPLEEVCVQVCLRPEDAAVFVLILCSVSGNRSTGRGLCTSLSAT